MFTANPKLRSALLSAAALGVLVGLKLGVGLAAASLALIAAGLESSTDLISALLTAFAVHVAQQPADDDHLYGHGRAEQLSALAESIVLTGGASVITVQAVRSLIHPGAGPRITWYVYLVAAVAIVLDISRSVILARSGHDHHSPALKAGAVHATTDVAGSASVLVGVILAGQGLHHADAVAAIAVALIVLVAAFRLASSAIHQLMDRASAADLSRAEATVRRHVPAAQLGRLRLRQSAGHYFADVVIYVAPTAVIGQGHAVADDVEDALQEEFPGADVVVHIEPGPETSLHERALAAAMSTPRVREVHNVTLLKIDGKVELSLHLKLPGVTLLDEAHAVADDAEQAILRLVPEISRVQSHIEPLEETISGVSALSADVAGEQATVLGVVQRVLGCLPRELRFVSTAEGLVVLLTLPLSGMSSLELSHQQAKAIEDEVMRAHPTIAEVIVHTEP